MKGASVVFEQVLIFMMGVFIFLVSFTTFSTYGRHFEASISEGQIQEVSELIASNLVLLSGREEVNSTVKLKVPAMIGNEPYDIKLRDEGLNITTRLSRRSLFTPLESLGRTYSLSGGFSTVHGSEFLLYKKGGNIIIG